MRRIKSYVRREGRMTKRQQQAFENYWNDYVVDLDSVPSLNALFPEGPITLEIGFGMGASLAEMARLQPQMNFLGVEVHRPGVASLIADLQELELNNVKIICDDAIRVINEFLPNDSLDRVLLFFPDPWHKKRHNKRRIVQSEFVFKISNLLKYDGIFHMATDWQPYAEHIQEVMSNFSQFSLVSTELDPRLETKFERRGLRLGHLVVDLVYKKTN